MDKCDICKTNYYYYNIGTTYYCELNCPLGFLFILTYSVINFFFQDLEKEFLLG